MPVTEEELREIVFYLFLHKWLAVPYSEGNAKLLEDGIKSSLKDLKDSKEEN